MVCFTLKRKPESMNLGPPMSLAHDTPRERYVKMWWDELELGLVYSGDVGRT